jgi:DNA-directed RNA polymerase subunit RPC12/RpoP
MNLLKQLLDEIKDENSRKIIFSKMEELKKKTENLKDIELECSECGKKFIFTTGEQKFFMERSLSKPRRCPDCRQRRKAEMKTGQPFNG